MSNLNWKCKCGWVTSGDRFYCDNCGGHISQNNERKEMKLYETIQKNKEEIQNFNKIKNTTEFYESLISAVKDAGGATGWITEKTTLKELADILSPNNVRFTYTKECKNDYIARGDR